jgi:hypothetical protein
LAAVLGPPREVVGAGTPRRIPAYTHNTLVFSPRSIPNFKSRPIFHHNLKIYS